MSDLSNVTAVILAGGLGTRLRRVVSDRPKVMAEINGRPFLSYLLDQLAKAGIARVVVSTGYMAAYIEEHIGLKHKGLLVDYSREDTPLGTGGALKIAGHMLDTKYCLVMNGDSYAEFDPVSLLTAHEKSSAKITLVVKAVVDSSRYGTVRMGEDNTIKAFTEKSGATEGGLINVGIYLINTTELQEIPDDKPCSLEYDFLPRMTGKGLYGFEISGRFIDIGTPKSYVLAKKFFREANCTPLITDH